MKLIIAGSRRLVDDDLIESMILSIVLPEEITEIVSGNAQGVDRLAIIWAESNELPVRIFEADWSTYGKSAGPKRNDKMAIYGDALLAIWDGGSKGTASMIQKAKERRIPVWVRVM